MTMTTTLDPIACLDAFAGLEVYHPPEVDALGAIVIAATAGGVARLDFIDVGRAETITARPSEHTHACREQLDDYFQGRRQSFSLPLDPLGTDFQRQVWKALSEIPFGETRSYAQIAEGLGRKGAHRAVGAANGRNPIAIVVPFHRVIGSDGLLTGYAGGMGRQQWLLAFEAQEVPLELC